MKYKEKIIAFGIFTLLITPPALADIVKQITVINNSNVSLKPTAEGFAQGCIGGSMPSFTNPLEPQTTRVIDIVFLQYTASCLFNVLPEPNIVTYEHACHQVKANDTVIFTGENEATLQCEIK